MKKLKNIALAIASLVIFTNITNAQALKASYSVNYDEPLKVKYIGEDANYLLFEVVLQSKIPGKTLFAIDDKNEGELYATGLAGNFSTKTIKIEKKQDQVLYFKLFLGRKTYAKSFSVNTSAVETTTVVENDITML